MVPWFSPESPKLSAIYRRPVRASGRNRTLGLLVVLGLLVALYFIGCSTVGPRRLLEGGSPPYQPRNGASLESGPGGLKSAAG